MAVSGLESTLVGDWISVDSKWVVAWKSGEGAPFGTIRVGGGEGRALTEDEVGDPGEAGVGGEVDAGVGETG